MEGGCWICAAPRPAQRMGPSSTFPQPPPPLHPSCCRRPGERYITRFQLAEEFEDDLCSTDPWLVLHKIDSPTKMRFVGQRVANCTAPEPWVLPASIETEFPASTRSFWAQQHEAVLAAAGRSSSGGAQEEEEEEDGQPGDGDDSTE